MNNKRIRERQNKKFETNGEEKGKRMYKTKWVDQNERPENKKRKVGKKWPKEIGKHHGKQNTTL